MRCHVIVEQLDAQRDGFKQIGVRSKCLICVVVLGSTYLLRVVIEPADLHVEYVSFRYCGHDLRDHLHRRRKLDHLLRRSRVIASHGIMHRRCVGGDRRLQLRRTIRRTNARVSYCVCEASDGKTARVRGVEGVDLVVAVTRKAPVGLESVSGKARDTRNHDFVGKERFW